MLFKWFSDFSSICLFQTLTLNVIDPRVRMMCYSSFYSEYLEQGSPINTLISQNAPLITDVVISDKNKKVSVLRALQLYE